MISSNSDSDSGTFTGEGPGEKDKEGEGMAMEGAVVMGRMAASICGRSIWPKGVWRTVSGREVMCEGMLWPVRNIERSFVKLLQLCFMEVSL